MDWKTYETLGLNRSMSDAPGIIIDLRGNPGGFDGVGKGLAGFFLDKKTSLGTSRSPNPRRSMSCGDR